MKEKRPLLPANDFTVEKWRMSTSKKFAAIPHLRNELIKGKKSMLKCCLEMHVNGKICKLVG
jgi:hypothetical protein